MGRGPGREGRSPCLRALSCTPTRTHMPATPAVPPTTSCARGCRCRAECRRAADPGGRWTPTHPSSARHQPRSACSPSAARAWPGVGCGSARTSGCPDGQWGRGPDLKEQPPHPPWGDSGLCSDAFRPYPTPLVAGGWGGHGGPGDRARGPRDSRSAGQASVQPTQAAARVRAVSCLSVHCSKATRAWPPNPHRREEEPVGGGGGPDLLTSFFPAPTPPSTPQTLPRRKIQLVSSNCFAEEPGKGAEKKGEPWRLLCAGGLGGGLGGTWPASWARLLPARTQPL